MKILDYKFLIVIGLTVIVYFLFREIENLNKKMKKLENKFEENFLMIDDNENSNNDKEFTLPLPNYHIDYETNDDNNQNTDDNNQNTDDNNQNTDDNNYQNNHDHHDHIDDDLNMKILEKVLDERNNRILDEEDNTTSQVIEEENFIIPNISNEFKLSNTNELKEDVNKFYNNFDDSLNILNNNKENSGNNIEDNSEYNSEYNSDDNSEDNIEDNSEDNINHQENNCNDISINTTNINIEIISEKTLSEESISSNVAIYSNDNDDDNHTSIIDSTDINNDINSELNMDNISFIIESSVNNLLKNHKLPELQDIATNLNISITKEGTNKKKTKAELAEEINSKKKNV
jgi:hypothetical protein